MENKDLTITTNEGKEMYVIDSREVAEMMGRNHEDIMKMIKGSGKNLGIIPILEKMNLKISDYFIESTYKIEYNRKTYKCYLVTKMGCELLGNKQQGEKGIIFSVLFNNRFKNMATEEIKQDVSLVCETLKENNKRKELNFLDKLEESLRAFNLKGIRQYTVKNKYGSSYKIDYYIQSLNIAIEYDENGHKSYTYEEHEGRQMYIENELNCKFIRVTDDESDEYNIGYIIKNIMEVK